MIHMFTHLSELGLWWALCSKLLGGLSLRMAGGQKFSCWKLHSLISPLINIWSRKNYLLMIWGYGNGFWRYRNSFITLHKFSYHVTTLKKFNNFSCLNKADKNYFDPCYFNLPLPLCKFTKKKSYWIELSYILLIQCISGHF